jgi:hypothetical protein
MNASQRRFYKRSLVKVLIRQLAIFEDYTSGENMLTRKEVQDMVDAFKELIKELK